MLINVSPIEYGHVLLCPWVLNRIPQLVDPANLLLALHFANESANPCMRLGYNSLGAYGTINHMHYQAYYMQHAFPVELAETVDLCQPEHADDYQARHGPCAHPCMPSAPALLPLRCLPNPPVLTLLVAPRRRCRCKR